VSACFGNYALANPFGLCEQLLVQGSRARQGVGPVKESGPSRSRARQGDARGNWPALGRLQFH
jgi:hypothetical protein